MPTATSIIRFVVIAGCCYAVFLGLWPHLGGAYAAAFRSAGNIAFHTFGANGTVRFESSDPMADEEFDGLLRIRNTRTGAGLSQPVSYRLLGYVPAIVTISLFIATLAADRGRWKALLVAVAAIHLLIALRVVIMLLALFSGNDQVAQFRFGNLSGQGIAFLHDLCVRSPTMNYVVALVLWMTLVLTGVRQSNRDAG